jgi:hypothetical protein
MFVMRVYLDTSIIGSYLRDNPAKVDDFISARHRGYEYYAGTHLGANKN